MRGIKNKILSVVRLIFVFTLILFLASPISASKQKDVKIEIIEYGEQPTSGNDTIETWCELRNYGGSGTADIRAWIQYDRDHRGFYNERKEEEISVNLSENSGDTLFITFNIPTDTNEYHFGYLILSQINQDGTTPSRNLFGAWGESLLTILGLLALAIILIIGYKLYVKWVRKVTDVAKDTGPVTRFQPTDKDKP